MKRQITIYIFIAFTGLFAAQCGEINENEKIAVPKYHTQSDEGIWIDKSSSHIPIITFSGKNEINVAVPMKPSNRPLHYIEAIVLMDGEREVDSKQISFSLDEPRAHFTLPDVEKGNYRVVVKCNIHDMWMAPVIIPGRVKKK